MTLLKSLESSLKKKVKEEFSYVLEDGDMEGDKKREIVLGGRKSTVRNLLIDVGRMYRNIDKGFWLDQLWKDAEFFASKGLTVVIDDVRYLNEAEFLSEKGVRLIRINRPGIPTIDDPSETELDGFPFCETIINDEDLVTLRNRVGALISLKNPLLQRATPKNHPQ